MNILMKCGHVANGYSGDKPCCVICNCFETKELPELTNRIAKCTYCQREAESNFDLPFFEYKEDQEYDEYYCGCRGWD